MLKLCRKNNEDMSKNHEFISNVRIGAGIIGKTSIKVATVAAVTFLVGAIYMYVKNLAR